MVHGRNPSETEEVEQPSSRRSAILTEILIILALVLANGLFAGAEIALVALRESRLRELADLGRAGAKAALQLKQDPERFLATVQVGITVVGATAAAFGGVSIAARLEPRLARVEWIGGHAEEVALTLVVVLVSYLSIVLGELVPKALALRSAERYALLVAAPLRLLSFLARPLVALLTASSNLVLWPFRNRTSFTEARHSENELRIILEESQQEGLMSFRRLLFMENVFDFGKLTARDAMRPRASVKCLQAKAPWPETLAAVRASRFSRYPLLQDDPERPVGVVHLKDLVLREGALPPGIETLSRPLLFTSEHTPLEQLLAELQRRRMHAAAVTNAQGAWIGWITLEDILEELVGTIRDEFENEDPTRLADALTQDCVHLDVEADSPVEAVRRALARMPAGTVPLPAEELVRAIAARERLVPTYLGEGIGMPHARIPGLSRPFVLLLRSAQGIACEGTHERAHLLFVLLTPAGQPRVHQRLQSIIATLMHESVYVKDRLEKAVTPAEVVEAIRTGEQAVLD